jgi:hypothetical protein
MRLLKDSGEFSDHELFEMASTIGLLKRDPVVRARLLYRARLSLRRIEPEQVPNEETLKAYLEQNEDSYRRAPRYRFSHVFFSKKLRGEDYEKDADMTLTRLSQGGFSSSAAHRLGDPLLKSRPIETLTKIEIEKRYGEAFLEAVAEQKLKHWLGPISSPFGLHLIRLDKVYQASVPALSEISNQIKGDLLKKLEEENYRARLASLKKAAGHRGDLR